MLTKVRTHTPSCGTGSCRRDADGDIAFAQFETKSNRVKGLSFHPKRCEIVEGAGARICASAGHSHCGCRVTSIAASAGHSPLLAVPQAMDTRILAQRSHPGAPLPHALRSTPVPALHGSLWQHAHMLKPVALAKRDLPCMLRSSGTTGWARS